MKATVKQISIPNNKRVICISDIHGSLKLFLRLLDKIEYTDDDILILLGDLYTKGKQGHDTLKFIIELSNKPNVYILRGNCDWKEEYLSEAEKEWLDNLPHIFEAKDYIFVHGGLTSNNLNEQVAALCTKNDAFMEKDLMFDKHVITGHWPTCNYTHEIPCCNPIINNELRIIAIDGGIVLKDSGQINAFIIHNGEFSFESIDDLPKIQIQKPQNESGGTLNITWFDRFVALTQLGENFSLYKHIKSGKDLMLPNDCVWTDNNGNLCECEYGTDYYLPVSSGEIVSLVKNYGSKIFAKKNGTVGWINV